MKDTSFGSYKRKLARISSCGYPIIQLKLYSILSKENTPRTLRTEECWFLLYLCLTEKSLKDFQIWVYRSVYVNNKTTPHRVILSRWSLLVLLNIQSKDLFDFKPFGLKSNFSCLLWVVYFLHWQETWLRHRERLRSCSWAKRNIDPSIYSLSTPMFVICSGWQQRVFEYDRRTDKLKFEKMSRSFSLNSRTIK